MQNTCKQAYFYPIAFPRISGDLLGLLHGCCTRILRTMPQTISGRSQQHIPTITSSQIRPRPHPFVFQLVSIRGCVNSRCFHAAAYCGRSPTSGSSRLSASCAGGWSIALLLPSSLSPMVAKRCIVQPRAHGLTRTPLLGRWFNRKEKASMSAFWPSGTEGKGQRGCTWRYSGTVC